MEAKIPRTLSHVSLVGAGPNAADLITVRGTRLLGEAEVVLHDTLVSPEVLQYCPQAVLIAADKRCDRRSATQCFVNRQLVNLATKRQRVMRLKGGDPMLFGRADEELQALEQADTDYGVVLGITTALAATSAIRRPLIKHGVARSVTFVTQAEATNPDTPQPRGAVSKPIAQTDSLVYYMSRDQATSIVADLIVHGRAPFTPAWVVEAAIMPEQRLACFTLQQMASSVAAEWINAEHPSLLMIGDALAVRASAAASKPALDAYPHNLAV